MLGQVADRSGVHWKFETSVRVGLILQFNMIVEVGWRCFVDKRGIREIEKLCAKWVSW